MNTNKFLETAPYSEIIRKAEELGYHRSRTAIQRETEEGSAGQYGLTLDEASEYLKRFYHAA